MKYEIDGKMYRGTHEEVEKQVRAWYNEAELIMEGNGYLYLRDMFVFEDAAKSLRTMTRIKAFLVDQAIERIPKQINIIGEFSVYINGEQQGMHTSLTLDDLIRIRDDN